MELEVWVALEVDRMLVEVEQGSGGLREEMTLEQRLEGSLNADSPASPPHTDVDAPRFVGQETFPLRNLLGPQMGTC